MAVPHDEARLQKLLKRVGELPTVPRVISELDALVEDPKTTAADLNDILSTDPGLGSKILRLANSSFYGIPRKVTNLTHAISLLGFNVIRNIALSAVMFRMFDTQRSTFDPEKYWLHSIATGAACRAIGETLEVGHAEDLFLLGLLHDIGKVVIAQHSEVNYAQIVPKAQAAAVPVWEVEIDSLGFNHCHVGALLARHWQFPPVIIDVLENHHTPQDAASAEVVALATFGDIVARSLHIGLWDDQPLPWPGSDPWTLMGGGPSHVGPVMDRTLQNMNEAKGVMDVLVAA